MKKLLLTASVISISLGTASNSYAITVPGTYKCLDYKGREVTDTSICESYAGRMESKPGLSTIECTLVSFVDDGDDGGGSYIDVDGDGLGDFSSIAQATAAGFTGNNGILGNYPVVGNYSRSAGVENVVRNNSASSSNTGGSGGGGFCCGSNSSVGNFFSSVGNAISNTFGGGGGDGGGGGGGGGGGCFVTTATVEVMGEADNGPTLSKLRHLRDFYTIHNHRGVERIQIYYDVAPKIVEKINGLRNSQSIWKNIYSDWINPISTLIDNNNFQEADRLYADMVIDLAWKYVMKDLKPDQRKDLFLHTFRIYQA